MGADVRPEVVEAASEKQGGLFVSSHVCKRDLPEQERVNCQGKFRRILGCGRFHVHAGGTRAIQWSEPLH